MTEKEIRMLVANTAIEYLYCNQADGSHMQIIDIYNNHRPLARGYIVKYTDPWCATFVSAVSILLGLTDIMPTECGCTQMIKLYDSIGEWQEDDSYVPEVGDVIFYDWDDDGAGDCTGSSEHVGIVVEVVGSKIKVIEGNKSNAVGFRTIMVNGKYIRGYGIPQYSKKADNMGLLSDEKFVEMYIVKEGDTLSEIAAKYDTTVNALAEINNISNVDLIQSGDKIYIPQDKKPDIYIVQEGDTLSQIAIKFKLDIEELATLNGIENKNLIFIGQSIKLE